MSQDAWPPTPRCEVCLAPKKRGKRTYEAFRTVDGKQTCHACRWKIEKKIKLQVDQVAADEEPTPETSEEQPRPSGSYDDKLRKFQRLKDLLQEPTYIMPLELRWFRMMRKGKKKYKYFNRPLKPDRVNKLVFLRPSTKDKCCVSVCGAVLLGEHDRNAPTQTQLGWLPSRPYGHKVLDTVFFSKYRTFFALCGQGGYPQPLTLTKREKTRVVNSLRVSCGLKKD